MLRNRFFRVVLATAVALSLAAGVLYARWQVELTEPSGPYPVGRAEYHLVDPSREEVFTEDPGDARELVVTVYYPAQAPAGLRPAPYADSPLASAIAGNLGVPPLALPRIQSHALAGTPIASTQRTEPGYPLIIFSPGLGTPPIFYTATLEDLASHGYVVAGVSHPYCVEATVFPDGWVAPLSGACIRFRTLHAQDAPEEVIRPARDATGAVWVADVRFALDQLARLNREDARLAGRLDLTRVGIFGHSFGGAAVLRAGQLDPRFGAAINLDGSLFGDEAALGLDRPFLWMRAEVPPPTDEQLAQLARAGITREAFEAEIARFGEQAAQVARDSRPGYLLMLRGARHNTYASDLALIAPLLSWLIPPEEVGTIAGERAVRVIDAYILAFFDKHLKGEAAPLLDGPSPDYPEVEFAVPGAEHEYGAGSP